MSCAKEMGHKTLSPTQSAEMLTYRIRRFSLHERRRREGRNIEKSMKEK